MLWIVFGATWRQKREQENNKNNKSLHIVDEDLKSCYECLLNRATRIYNNIVGL